VEKCKRLLVWNAGDVVILLDEKLITAAGNSQSTEQLGGVVDVLVSECGSFQKTASCSYCSLFIDSGVKFNQNFLTRISFLTSETGLRRIVQAKMD
jgi:hypothetical protein